MRSATGKIEANGFTLIEVLVVVTIVAVVASMVVLRLGSWRSGAEPSAQLERFAALLDHQCEQALFQSRPRGVRVTSEGYDFWQASGPGWAPLPEDAVARPRSWRGAVELDLVVEDRFVEIEDEPVAPQLTCQPLGEMTEFSLELARDAASARLVGEPGGRLLLETQ